MSNTVILTIDGKSITASENETILNVARANGIFIPALCYITRCSPTLACRLCLVEADEKQVYACNVKVKEGMNVKTVTPNIVNERRAIMEVYDVNHPLQCGVCDQSGECELQNYTLFMNVNSQNYSTKDIHRPTADWGVMKYDPGLCIVCERCVTVCKDMIGSNALSTVKRGAEALDKDYKTSMPKDAYAMWNKLNKSLIGYDEDACISCGECISACPVGALVSTKFQYKSNAWELEKIPASNPHTSDCTLLYYEVKHNSIDNPDKKIYRVTNELHFGSLNGASRFAFDFDNKNAKKDENEFKKAVEAFAQAKNILFNSYITNEEALILQKIAEKTEAKLVNSDAKAYQDFLYNYSLNSKNATYDATLRDIHNSNFVISLGSYLKSDAPSVKYALNNSVVLNKGSALYFHPLKDPLIEKIGKKGKSTEFISYEPFKEDSILYFILYKFGENLPKEIEDYLNSTKIKKKKTIVETIKEEVVEIVKDEESGEEKEIKKLVPKKLEKEIEVHSTTLCESFGKDEEFLDLVDSMLDKKDKFTLIIGEDLISHKNSKTLAKLCGLISVYTPFKVMIIPPQTNSLGVAKICKLEDAVAGYTVGYNQKADFELSALGDGDISIPALNQQEGTFTNIDKRVVPTNAAVKFGGYTLNDIANKILDTKVEYTIDYTVQLPLHKGFKAIEFDDLPNEYLNTQDENRGYILEQEFVNDGEDLDLEQSQIESLEDDEIFIYRANPINQFNEFTALSEEFEEGLQDGIFFGEELFSKYELNDGDEVEVSTKDKTLVLKAYLDKQISGDIPYISTFAKNSSFVALFDTYRFNKATIKKV